VPPLAADVRLMGEVSETTLEYDHEVKVPLYAPGFQSFGCRTCRAGISLSIARSPIDT
jgi:hypothetical protein